MPTTSPLQVGVFAFVAGFGVEAVQNPAAGLYGAFGFAHTFGHINPVRNTMGIGNYQRRAVVSIRKKREKNAQIAARALEALDGFLPALKTEQA